MLSALSAAAAFLAASVALAQPCVTGFQPGEPASSGIYDPFSAYVDPITEFQGKLVIGGAFSSAGPLSTRCIAAFDPATGAWSALGGGAYLGSTNGFGGALATFTLAGSPHLIFGGQFAAVRTAAGVNVPDTTSLAAWNGAQWSSLGTGWLPATGRAVWALLDWQPPQGGRVLVVGGGFPSVGAATAAGIATYNGQAWSNIGGPSATGIAGTYSPVVFSLAVYNGSLYVSGRFDTVNGVTSPNVARWTGSAWQRPGMLTNGGVTSDVSSLLVFDDGSGAKLYAAGYLLTPGGQAATVCAFNGTAWSRVGQSLGGRGTCLAAFNDGSGTKLYMGMTADGNQRYLYRLESNQWVPVDGGVATPLTGGVATVVNMYATADRLYVGGNFQSAGGETAHGIAQYGPCPPPSCGSGDFDCNGDWGTDADLEAFFRCLAGSCPAAPCTSTADFNGDGDVATDPDIEAFFRVLAGGAC